MPKYVSLWSEGIVDANVNRATSMTMMIQAARRSVGRQFILITPQAMNNVEMGDDVKVHKMSDPERGQTTLPYA